MAKSRKRKPNVEAQVESRSDDPSSEPAVLNLAESAWGQVEQVRKGATRLHVWLMTIIGLAQPWAVGWFDPTETLPGNPWSFYWTVLQTTAPLTVGLTLWMCLLIACWPNDSEGGYVMLMGLVGGLILTGAAHLGNWLGARQVELIEPIQTLGMFNGLVNALVSYLRAYRGALFVSALGIATYAGYLTYSAVSRREAAKPAGEVAAPRSGRRAA